MPGGTGKGLLNEYRAEHGLEPVSFTYEVVQRGEFAKFIATVCGGHMSVSKEHFTKKEAEHVAAENEYIALKQALPEGFIRDTTNHPEAKWRLTKYTVLVSAKNDTPVHTTHIIEKMKEMGDENFIGVDFERSTVPGQAERTTLIQIASAEICILLRCGINCSMAAETAEAVKALLQNDAVIKYGVGLASDKESLKNDLSIILANAHDIAADESAKQYGCIKNPGMAKLTTHWLQEDAAYKNAETGTEFSDSDADLTQTQQDYAALDAILSYALGKKIHDNENLANLQFMYTIAKPQQIAQ
jgi:hypothetical protein